MVSPLYQANRRFGCIILADNSFRELTDKDQHFACLKCVRRHLKDGSLFLLRLRCHGASQPAEDVRPNWSHWIERSGSSERVRRKVERIADENKNIVTNVMTYEIDDSMKIRTEKFSFSVPLMFKEDYFSLLENAGFSVTDSDYQEITGRKEDDSILSLVCQKNDFTV